MSHITFASVSNKRNHAIYVRLQAYGYQVVSTSDRKGHYVHVFVKDNEKERVYQIIEDTIAELREQEEIM
ncbi:hypothetical protein SARAHDANIELLE_70 [Hafnia phage vB_HpaM_SarahDanielle]|uniref:Uncharacterized protein n=1 Tax=Hafnia phage vB_HpaM_SarahDanielle TaxID=2836113 RepID=A0AAE8BD06_9CAUD|nr:hypothetical protein SARAHDANIELLE_70 [Hafnia phage vB_HpaM_SarahDanielle]